MRNMILPVVAALTMMAASAHATVYTTTLSSLNQVPPQESAATGSAIVDVIGNMLSADVIFKSLAGASPFGHIHCCAPAGDNAGVAIPFVDFPQMETGEYKHTFDLLNAGVYEAAFLSSHGGTAMSARDALLAGLAANLAYVNIHDAPAYPEGEIRGQLARSAAVPEPAAFALFGLGGLALVAARRRA